MFEEHRKQLASLKAEYERLVALAQRSEELSSAQAHTAQAIEAVAEKLLGDRSNGNAGATAGEAEEELANLEKRRLSLRVQLDSLSAKQRKAEEALQKRLDADITASGLLEAAWLEHVVQREANVLLETVASGRSGTPEIAQAARVLANAGKVYAETIASLGATAPVTWSWTRPLDPPASEKSAYSQQIVAHDPMFAAPKRSDTVAALLDAAAKQVARWEGLLAKIEGSLKVFALPGYVEPAKRQQSSLEYLEPLSGGTYTERELKRLNKKWEDLSETDKEFLRKMEKEEQQNIFRNYDAA